MSPTDEQLRTALATDPIAAVARLADSGMFAEYVVYERPGEWIFAGDALGSVALDTDRLCITWRGETRTNSWTGRPAEVIGAALEELRTLEPDAGYYGAYGWLAFESCAYGLGLREQLDGRTPLAHLIVPRIEVRIDESGARLHGGTPSEQDAILRLIAEPQDADVRTEAPLDIY
ncbi:MAG: salicylate synthase, partial [Aldersonia sp.]|nr:salicylate synthase [Aldersonia sp.]